MKPNTITVRIGGEAGMGLESSGAGFGKAIVRGGLYAYGLPDFYSRIRGGHNFFTLRIGNEPLYAIEDDVHILIALDIETVRRHTSDLVSGAAIVYDSKDEIPDELRRDDVTYLPVAMTQLAKEIGGNEIMRNTLAIGTASGLLGFDTQYIESVIRDNFAGKGGAVVDGNLQVLARGWEAAQLFAGDFPFRVNTVPDPPQRLFINGTEAFSLGALAGGCRFISGYPMTPGSPVLVWFAQHAAQYGVVAKHVEDEISAINMAIGASLMGVRSMVPTSGGGYALMVEATGLAGIYEAPVVIYNAQRPGPATGMPTRTEQGDMLFMLFAAQGEFPRFLLAPGSVESLFHLGWQAFNLAELYQTPAMVLSDQFLADGFRTIEPEALDFDAVTFERGVLLNDADLDALTEPYLRFKDTASGISPRAIPGHPNAIWNTSSDEHSEKGAIDEDPTNRTHQVNKRMRKMTGADGVVPEPSVYGPENADVSLICWGSTYGPTREAVDWLDGKANMIHFSALEPFPAGAAALLKKAKKRIAVELNATGQLASLIRMRTGIEVDGSILKYDGRPFRAATIVAQLKEVTQW
ncbi:MAG: 2-oxoacid:acceptor oxidoreductase subunit alpha [Anaerolineales bacterium]|nr:MAG: 2-oxoacid:acceptor oxidoreductase subunit alpha [Anaerolineales bacterium]